MPEDLPQDRPLRASWLASAIGEALDEDLGGEPGRDVTTQATIPASATVTGEIVMREDGVIAGIPVIGEALGQVAERLSLPMPVIELRASDGDRLAAGAHVADLSGPGHVVLIAERTILNFVSRASGVATHTRRWADALEGTGARVLDTRKTTPGLRELEKYAVRAGGGVNKRFGLHDCAMVKDNHILAAGSVTAAIEAIAQRFPSVPVQVEVEREAQALEAIDAGARFLMLDNMGLEEMRAVVQTIRALEPQVGRVQLEATGGLTLDNAREVAATGVDFMSVGALTHSSPIIDLALDLH
ncbi:carboxylating nicotinate-nucleotide diphosphorylase [Demequina activiva]|uniref:Nicotinate-nucleotide pyrophosphorylase [carboxylating] n=1 Tax=Demequina activiva TaxID=1582364 RepID=A0A919Q3G9_9MICO|nr:carboxylating nicotinate-nucleotide diphosphorylase [Demequina activiva]GIG53738.1 nicotinate-nucleotide diphosphorylase (carboxylating) [Demequina activiva]